MVDTMKSLANGTIAIVIFLEKLMYVKRVLKSLISHPTAGLTQAIEVLKPRGCSGKYSPENRTMREALKHYSESP